MGLSNVHSKMWKSASVIKILRLLSNGKSLTCDKSSKNNQYYWWIAMGSGSSKDIQKGKYVFVALCFPLTAVNYFYCYSLKVIVVKSKKF